MKLIQITDLHLMPPGETIYALDPAERLAACVADINANHGDAALVVVTGDLAHAGQPAAYGLLRELLAPLAPPAHLLIGNHDDRAAFQAAFPEAPRDEAGFVQFTVDTPAARLVCLDTHVPGAPHGALCDARLGWLERELDRAGDRPVYLFMHHPPFRVGLKRMDEIALRDGDRLAAVLAGRTSVRHLFFGHLHRPLNGCWKGIPFTNLPGLSHQVRLDFVIEGRVPGSHEPPAYAVVLAEPDLLVVHLHNFLDRTGTFLL